ncbi:MAG: SGNH/GDSL hydrolase family protein [Bacilli bacterium]
MKKRSFIFSLCLLLIGCSGPSTVTNDSITIDSTMGGTSSVSEENIPGKIDENVETFDYDGNIYTARGEDSYLIMSTAMNEGMITTKISPTCLSSQAAVIFNYQKESGTYYKVGLREDDTLGIAFFDGATLSEVKVLSTMTITDNFIITLKLFAQYDFITVSINDGKPWCYETAIVDNSYLGFYAKASGTIFSDVKMNRNAYLEDMEASSYINAYGSMNLISNKIIVKKANSLFVNNHKTFENGVFEYTYYAQGNNALVGCVFCLDDGGKTTFWRDAEVSYYYLGISITGALNLYKLVNGVLTSEKYYVTYMLDDTIEHTVKIVKNANVFDFYLDGKYQMSYQDTSVLTGTKVGLCSQFSSGYYKNVKITPIVNIDANKIGDVDVYRGGFASTFDTVRATTTQSLCLVKTPMSSSQGTIKTVTGSIKTFGYGLVFNVTKPDRDIFYETEPGLSYYYFCNAGNQFFKLGRYDNGTVTWTQQKYVSLSIEHGGEMRVVLDNNRIYCYYLNRLIIEYIDSDPLTGTYYGFKSDVVGGSFSHGINFENNHSVDKAQYLIFGHSYTHLWLKYKRDFAELGENNVLSVGIGGAKTHHYTNLGYVNEMAVYEPEWGIYWNGINDINADVNLATMAQNVESTMTGIKSRVPNFKCVIIGINYCTYEKSLARMSQIAEANIEYKKICDKYDFLEFVDVKTLFCDDEGQPLDRYFVDKLHPSEEAYQMVAALVIVAIANH